LILLTFSRSTAFGQPATAGRKGGSGPRLRALLAETAARLVATRIEKLDEAALDPLVAAVRGGDLDITSAAERLLKEVVGED
jgi:hypothetical protein